LPLISAETIRSVLVYAKGDAEEDAQEICIDKFRDSPVQRTHARECQKTIVLIALL
jgi:hypothetical protein